MTHRDYLPAEPGAERAAWQWARRAKRAEAMVREISVATALDIADLIEPFSGIDLANGATRADVAAWIRARIGGQEGNES